MPRPNEMATERASAFGIGCFAGGVQQASAAVVARARAGPGGYACLCNVHVLMTAQRDRRLREALTGAWCVFPDGSPVAWLLRNGGALKAERIAGADLMTAVMGLGRSVGLRHYLFGSTPAVTEALQRRLRAELPGVEIVGSSSPPVTLRGDGGGSVTDILQASPDVVWCGLGAPKQELWMQRNARKLAPAVLVGVGAAFDFLAESKRRAPAWMQRSSLEWLHRLASEPRRLAWRYLRTNSEFLARAAIELGTPRRSRRKPPPASA